MTLKTNNCTVLEFKKILEKKKKKFLGLVFFEY